MGNALLKYVGRPFWLRRGRPWPNVASTDPEITAYAITPTWALELAQAWIRERGRAVRTHWTFLARAQSSALMAVRETPPGQTHATRQCHGLMAFELRLIAGGAWGDIPLIALVGWQARGTHVFRLFLFGNFGFIFILGIGIASGTCTETYPQHH